MTAADLQALAADAKAETLHVQGVTEQSRLRGLTATAETFGLPECDTHLIAKLRNMPPALRETILPTPKAAS